MKAIAQTLAMVLAALLTACAPQLAHIPLQPAPVAQAEIRKPVTILVSIDAFRADYLDRGETPTLSRLAKGGVSAAMIPSFPSKTFPNHWAEVTGKYPDHSGITANSFTDPARPDEKFTMATTDPFYWNAAEPIWVTAEKAGIRTAAMFWPGSAVGWGGSLIPHGYGRVDRGIWPQDWQAFDQNVTPVQRVNTVLDWLRRPAAIRPKLVLLYFDEVDTAGHEEGPHGKKIDAALRDVDGDIAMLLEGLKQLHQPANIVITSDHGMAETSSNRVIALDSILDPADYDLIETGTYATLAAKPGHEKALEAKLLVPHDHMHCWRKHDIPARFHYGNNPRIPPYFCLAQTGWEIFAKPPSRSYVGGNHGYDNRAPEMAALFIANGPAFRQGARLPAFENVDIAPLMRKLLGLPQDPRSDGKLAPVSGAFAP